MVFPPDSAYSSLLSPLVAQLRLILYFYLRMPALNSLRIRSSECLSVWLPFIWEWKTFGKSCDLTLRKWHVKLVDHDSKSKLSKSYTKWFLSRLPSNLRAWMIGKGRWERIVGARCPKVGWKNAAVQMGECKSLGTNLSPLNSRLNLNSNVRARVQGWKFTSSARGLMLW